MTQKGYTAVPVMLSNEKEHRRQIAQLANNLLAGKSNNVVQVTLNANATSTTITDARIGANTFIGFTPLTTNASAAVTSGMHVYSQQNGSAVLVHPSSPNVDQTFNVVLIG